MDPLTHALTGAALAWAASGARLGRRALLVGGAAALLPDLDVLIRSADDPLLAIEHHRGFTHSLLFAPIGGTLAALLLGGRHDRCRAVLAGILAWLSHALLDAATTYGTQLLWPFSRLRVGLDIISIIDPLFTLIVLGAVVAAFRARRRAVAATLVLAAVWLALGFVQRERATAAQRTLAERRGDRVARAALFPTVGNTIVWRSVYETDGMLRLDRIRVPWLGEPAVAEGTAVPLVRATHRDFARFAWFSDGWVAADPADPTLLGDARYSLDAHRYRPVWGIRLGARTEWVNRSRERRVSLAELWREIAGRDRAFRPLQVSAPAVQVSAPLVRVSAPLLRVSAPLVRGFRTTHASFRTGRASFRTPRASFRTARAGFPTGGASFRTAGATFRTACAGFRAGRSCYISETAIDYG